MAGITISSGIQRAPGLANDSIIHPQVFAMGSSNHNEANIHITQSERGVFWFID